MEYIIQKRWKRIVSVVRKNSRNKVQVSRKLKKIDSCFYQIVMFWQEKVKVHEKSRTPLSSIQLL